jgi:hypothetical protein
MVKPSGGTEAARDGHLIGAFYRPGGGEPSRLGGRQTVVGEVDSINASVARIRRGMVEGEVLGEEGDRAVLGLAWLHNAPEGAWRCTVAMTGKLRAAAASISYWRKETREGMGRLGRKATATWSDFKKLERKLRRAAKAIGPN